MATRTITLSQNYKNLATYGTAQATYLGSQFFPRVWSPEPIEVPVWNSGIRKFEGYYYGLTKEIGGNGRFINLRDPGGDFTLNEKWTYEVAAANVLSVGNELVGELAYSGGAWYSDWKNRVPLDADHPMTVPTRETYRFLGCFATNATTGTKYINADGTPTAAFLALAPTDNVNIYAQWELASVKITVYSAHGDYAFKAFYQSIAADADGKYGYYTDSACAPGSRIYAIPAPTRELYSWLGLHETSAATSEEWTNSNGLFTEAFLGRASAAVTAYGDFWRQRAYKITVDANGGTAPAAAYYTDVDDGGVYTHWIASERRLLSLPVPVRSQYRFLGYYSARAGGTKYVEHDGTILDALNTRKATTTICAQWRSKASTVTLDAGGGTGGGTLYYDATDGAFFDGSSATVAAVPVPSYTGNTFTGYFDAQDGGTRIVDASGAISPDYAPQGDVTLYAHYTIGKSAVDVDAGEGAGGTARFYYDHARGKFYADADLTEEITSVTLPTVRLFDTTGLYTASEGGSSVVDADGEIAADWHPTGEYETVYARYSRRCYEVQLDAGGGAGSLAAIYHPPTSFPAWYADEFLTEAVSNVGVPERTGYTFGGFFRADPDHGDVTVADADGEISLTGAYTGYDYVATATWTAKTYTLAFNAYPGTPSFPSKTVTYDAPVGTLPTTSLAGRRFAGWRIDGEEIKAGDVWRTDSDKTANAEWVDSFGGCTDWFGLETANGPLMLVGSTDGAARTVIETSHTGAIDNVNVYGILMNPTCTYRIRKAGTVQIRLGKAWAKSGTAKSGYMIVSGEYATAADGEPVLVVRGAANEGADAINRWDVSIAVKPDHIAQDPMNAVSGGGEMTECKTLVTCDPVVPTENGMPCASDVVHGKVVVTATTNAYFGESAPTAGNGFVETGAPTNESDVDFTTYAIAAERSL